MALRGAALGVPSSGPGAGGAQATRRIQRELKEISSSPSRHWTAGPVGDDLFEWQFVMRGPPGTDYEGGIYVGRIVLPVNYPLAPPSITLLTPNGRWEVGKKICLSNTNYHPDLWQPAWGIRTMMEALRSHFPFPGDGAIGALDWPSDLRQRLARESLDWRTQPGARPNRELLPELSPEELREELPEPAPFLQPEEAQEELPRPTPSAGSLAAQGGAAASPAMSPPVPATPPPSPVDAGPVENLGALPPSQEGLRQRRPAGSGDASGSSSGALGSEAAAPEAGSSSSAGPRRRREPARQQRRPQPLLVQILKPPSTGRGWVLLLMDLIIALLTISFLMGVTDIIRTPPKLLDALPDARSSTE